MLKQIVGMMANKALVLDEAGHHEDMPLFVDEHGYIRALTREEADKEIQKYQEQDVPA